MPRRCFEPKATAKRTPSIDRRLWPPSLFSIPTLGSTRGWSRSSSPRPNIYVGDAGSDPASATDRKAYYLVAEGFGAGANGPLLVLTAHPDPERIAALPDVAHVLPSGTRDGWTLFTVVPESGPESTATLVSRLREDPSLLVTGQTAVQIDISAHLRQALPLYLALVAGFAFLLLMVVFRAVLIPLKAVLSFLLSLGAALGCTVAIFQWGWFGLAGPPGPVRVLNAPA